MAIKLQDKVFQLPLEMNSTVEDFPRGAVIPLQKLPERILSFSDGSMCFCEYIGVSSRQAQIGYNGSRLNLGRFPTAVQAAHVRDRVARILGRTLNFPEDFELDLIPEDLELPDWIPRNSSICV